METSHLQQSLETAKEIADQNKLEDRFSLIRKLNEEFSNPMEIEFMIAALRARIETIEQQIDQFLERVQQGELTWNRATQKEYGDINVKHYRLEVLIGSLSIILEAIKQKYSVDDVLAQLEQLHEMDPEERAATIKRFLKTKEALNVANYRFIEKRPAERGVLPTPGHPKYEILTNIGAVIDDLKKAIGAMEEEEKQQSEARLTLSPVIEDHGVAQIKPQEKPTALAPLPQPDTEPEPQPVPSMDALYDAVSYRYDLLRSLGVNIYETVHYQRINKASILDVINRAEYELSQIGFFAGLIKRKETKDKKERVAELISELKLLSKTIDEQQTKNRERE